MDYIYHVEGSPLIPPDLLIIYFAVFVTALVSVYVFLRFTDKYAHPKQHLKTIVRLALAIKVVLFIGTTIIAAYLFIPRPGLVSTTPQQNTTDVPTTQKLTFVFDRPVSRSALEKSITPQTPGIWKFESSIYRTHLLRRVVFYPTTSFTPNTQYTVVLANIQNAARISKPYTATVVFTTQSSPEVSSVSPSDTTKHVPIDEAITINLTKPNDLVSQFDFALSPDTPVATTLNKTKTSYTLIPKERLKQGTAYTLTVKKTDLVWNLQDKVVVEKGETKTVYEGTFSTKEAPGIERFTPSGTHVLLNTAIHVVFSQDMDKPSVEEHLSIKPPLNGEYSWMNNRTLIIKPKQLPYETHYVVTIAQGAKALEGGFIREDITKSLTTIGRVTVTHIDPQNGWLAVGIRSPIKVTFDQEVDKSSAQERFLLSPSLSGDIHWEGNTMVFEPSTALPYSTAYSISIKPGVKSIHGLDSQEEFSSSFTTQEQTVKLAVPIYLQQHALSCEMAALRMALAFRNIHESEETLLTHVGVDTTPHSGTLWGDPFTAFVGNVDGKQMVDGYGVYWEPIGRVTRIYRDAHVFESWSIDQVTKMLAAGNPVIIWVYSSGGWPTSWQTPQGKEIYAVRDEHAVTAVGFVGPAHSPSQIIVNDPLIGQVYWSRKLFEKKWNIFERSGVVVY